MKHSKVVFGLLVVVWTFFVQFYPSHVYAQEFGRKGPVDVAPGEVVLIQIEDGTPKAEPPNYSLLVDPRVKSGIVLQANIDGRVDPFRDEDDLGIKVNIQQAGTYFVFCNCSSTSGSDDSFFVGFDDEAFNDNFYRFNLGPDNGEFTRQWVTSEALGNAVLDFPLDAGGHVLNWHMREPGAKVDWVAITDNPNLDINAVEEPGAGGSIIVAQRVFGQISFDPGEQLSVVLEVSNGGSDASSVTVQETPPSGWTVSNISGGGTAGGGTINWAVNNLAGGASVNLTYNVTVPANFSGDQVSFNGVVLGNALGDLGTGGVKTLTVNKPLGIFKNHLDIGLNPGAAGNATFDEGTQTYTVSGSGNDIWNQSDNFHFLYQEVSGDVNLIATVNLDVGNGDATWAKAGPMVRNNLTGGSAHAFAMIRNQGQDFGPQWRESQGAGGAWDGDATLAGGKTGAGIQTGKVEIERRGNEITFFFYDPVTDEQVFWLLHDVPEMEDPVFVGFAVTAHQTGSISTGAFTGVQLLVNGQEVTGPVSVENWSLF